MRARRKYRSLRQRVLDLEREVRRLRKTHVNTFTYQDYSNGDKSLASNYNFCGIE